MGNGSEPPTPSAMRFRCLAATVVAVLAAPATAAASDPGVAALQVALKAKRLYTGPIDGVAGAATETAVRALQRKKGLAVDGVFGPATRAALGRFGRHTLGSRDLRLGAVGWDVAALQFLLAQRGFASGDFDGRFGPRLDNAVRRFQRATRVPVDGVAGAATLRALRRSVAGQVRASFVAPVAVTPTDGFGARGGRFHTGLDYPAPTGTPVVAVRDGRVTYAGWHGGGWGNLVGIAHGDGVRTMYAHLSHVAVRVGQRVAQGTTIGAVGSSGHSTGPHLHFEVRVRGAAVDPRSVLH